MNLTVTHRATNRALSIEISFPDNLQGVIDELGEDWVYHLVAVEVEKRARSAIWSRLDKGQVDEEIIEAMRAWRPIRYKGLDIRLRAIRREQEAS